jgi:hypothetical protein
MTEAPKPDPDSFLNVARKLECDEDEAAFEETVRKLATAPPAPKAEKPE